MRKPNWPLTRPPALPPDQVGKLSHALKDAQEAIEIANEEKMVLMRTVDRLTDPNSPRLRRNEHMSSNCAPTSEAKFSWWIRNGILSC